MAIRSRPLFSGPLTALVILVAALPLAPGPLDAQVVRSPRPGAPGEWRIVGRTEANLGADHDAIVVRGFDNFRAVKFVVTDAPLRIMYLTITFDAGGTQRVNVRQAIPEGGESRVIDLPGIGQRSIRRIDFWYETIGVGRGRADVTVFGMR